MLHTDYVCTPLHLACATKHRPLRHVSLFLLIAAHIEDNPYKTLEIDLGPFNRDFPRMQMAKSIGNGVTFLNRHLSGTMFQAGYNGMSEGKVQLFEFLRLLRHQGQSLLINPSKLSTVQQLQQALLRADRYLDELDDEVMLILIVVNSILAADSWLRVQLTVY